MQSPIRIALACGLAMAALAASAQPRRLRDYRLHEQEDKTAPFAMTLGPDNTLYTLIPRRDGNWVLSRVQRWWLDHPDELGIVVEGFSARDPIASLGQMDLAVTLDGQYLVVLLSAPLRVAPDDAYPMDMIVELVRLDSFQSVDAEHLRALGIRGNLLSTLDRAGHVLIDSSIPASGSDAGTAPYVTWFRISVPGLKPELMCSYQAAADPKDPKRLEEACAAFAKTEGYASAAEVAATFPPAAPPANPAQPPAGVAISPKDRFQFRAVTIDGKPLTLVVLNGVDVEVYAQE